MKEIPIATVATAYDCPFTGKVYVLVLNEVLYFGDKMNHTLLCPNQLRANGLILDDCPTQFNENSSHSIYIPSCDLRIPLELDGVISGVVTRQPTMAELDDLSLHVELTSDLEWDPYSPDFASAEEHVQGKGKGTRSILSARVEHIQLGLSAQRMIEVETVENDDLAIRLISAVKLFGPQEMRGAEDGGDNDMVMKIGGDNTQVSAVIRGDPSSELSPDTLAARWGIGREVAKRTLDVTTQLGVRKIVHPAQRRFRTAAPHL
jgi:hypothetical protein